MFLAIAHDLALAPIFKTHRLVLAVLDGLGYKVCGFFTRISDWGISVIRDHGDRPGQGAMRQLGVFDRVLIPLYRVFSRITGALGITGAISFHHLPRHAGERLVYVIIE